MPPACNKCRVGIAQEGDSWCLGCSSLELSQGLLRQAWRQPGLRAVSEEALLSSARLVRAFANLDQSLGGGSAGSQEHLRRATTSAKVKPERPRRSRSPRRDTRPPLIRSPAGGRYSEARSRDRPASDYSDFDQEEEEEEEEDAPATEVKREHPGSRRLPEPEGPPPEKPPHSHHHSSERKDHEEKPHREGKTSGKRRRAS